MKLTEIFDSTKGKGISKKFLALFLTGTVMPLMYTLGIPEYIIQGFGQVALGYIGVQGIADAAYNFRNGKNAG